MYTPSPLLSLHNLEVEPKSYYERVWKRVIDVILSGFALLVLSPLLLVVALSIRFDSPGPIVFRQQRVGRNGELFSALKFRSMYTHVPSYGPSPTDSNDPRLTRVGRVIRSLSLDELPQLINVLRGDMSLVGPRALTPQAIERRISVLNELYPGNEWLHAWLYDIRQAVRPGITGLAQVSGRSSLTVEEATRYDLNYIEQFSFGLDFIVLCKTVVQVVKRRGVN